MKLQLAISALGAAGVSAGSNVKTEGDRLRGLANRNNGQVCETLVRDWTYNKGIARKCFLPIPEDYDEPNECLGVATGVLEDIGTVLGDSGALTSNITCQAAKDGGFGQTGVDVTCDSQGNLPAAQGNTPINDTSLPGLVPINIHFHIGAEHKSYGEYDLDFRFKGPSEEYIPERFRLPKSRAGKRCNFYNAKDERFNPAKNHYRWKHCVDVTVGETYEFHWPHTNAGLASEDLQYQGSFADGLLCKANGTVIGEDIKEANEANDNGLQILANALAVQAQVFTIIDDEAYDIDDPEDLIKGMLVDEDRGLEGNSDKTPNAMGQYISIYTGSRTGGIFGSSTNDPRGCDPISPVTWHVDRKCHLISARSLDAWCEAVVNLGRGMVRCTDRDCLGMPLRAVFKNPLVSDDNPGEYCCYPTIRTGTARNVNDETLANNNREHLQPDDGTTCEKEIEEENKELGEIVLGE